MTLPAQCKHGVMKRYCPDCKPTAEKLDKIINFIRREGKNMKLTDMTFEQLLLKIDDGDNQDIFAELLSRLQVGERAIKENILFHKLSDEDDETMRNLECCGNCIRYYAEGFKIGDCSPKMKRCCDKWESDNLKREERLIA